MGKRPKKKRQSKKAAAAPVRRNKVMIIAFSVIAFGSVIGALVGIVKLFPPGQEEASGSGIKFPSFVNDPFAPRNTPKAYQAAVDFYEDFSHIPCFCGCGQHSGHTSLQSCFISSRNGDEFKFGDHGAG